MNREMENVLSVRFIACNLDFFFFFGDLYYFCGSYLKRKKPEATLMGWEHNESSYRMCFMESVTLTCVREFVRCFVRLFL